MSEPMFSFRVPDLPPLEILHAKCLKTGWNPRPSHLAVVERRGQAVVVQVSFALLSANGPERNIADISWIAAGRHYEDKAR